MSNKPKVRPSKWDRLMRLIFWMKVAIVLWAIFAILALALTLAAGERPVFLP